jgi:poly-gamma-glutamate capsule biosynthesis protein CapA/YwtB (metallophosphatase superfamily)
VLRYAQQLNKKGIKMSISLARHHLAQVQKRVDYLKNIVEGLQGVHSEALALALNTTIEKAETDFKKACIELEQAEKSYNDILQKAKEKADFSKNNHIVSRTLKWS